MVRSAATPRVSNHEAMAELLRIQIFKQQRSLQTQLRDLAAQLREFCSEFPTLLVRGHRECRTLGASAATCALVESARVSHHGHAGNVRHSPRNGFNGFLRALPGDRALLPPSSPRSLLLKNLTPASGRQDHTTSPSASGALVFGTIRIHRIPPRGRDDRVSPLWDGTAADIEVIWGGGEADSFSRGGRTGRKSTGEVICPAGGRSMG